MLVEWSVTPEGDTPRLRDALTGLRPDSAFYSVWVRNRDQLAELLDALDEAYPPLPLRVLGESEAVEQADGAGDASRVVLGQGSL